MIRPVISPQNQNHMRGLIERNGLEFGAYYNSLPSKLLSGSIASALLFQTRDFKT